MGRRFWPDSSLVEIRVEPRELAVAGQTLRRLGAESRDDVSTVGSLLRGVAEQLGSQHAGSALLSTWRELATALEVVADGYGEVGRALSVLAPAYASVDDRLLRR